MCARGSRTTLSSLPAFTERDAPRDASACTSPASPLSSSTRRYEHAAAGLPNFCQKKTKQKQNRGEKKKKKALLCTFYWWMSACEQPSQPHMSLTCFSSAHCEETVWCWNTFSTFLLSGTSEIFFECHQNNNEKRHQLQIWASTWRVEFTAKLPHALPAYHKCVELVKKNLIDTRVFPIERRISAVPVSIHFAF